MERDREMCFGINDLSSWTYPTVVPYRVGNIYIEPTNHCNLRCVMCPHSKVRMKQGFIDWDLFLRIADDVSSYNSNAFIQLFYLGESLLHPRILEMIGHLKRNNLRVHLATNATLLDETMAYGLINAGLDHITFSFEGTDPKTYESIRIGGNYGVVLENIVTFLRVRAEEKADTRTAIEIIEMNATRDGIPDFIRRLGRLPVDEIRVKRLLGWAGTLDCDEIADRSQSKPGYPCNRPWRMLAITWDGLFLPCCVDAERKCVVGDAHSDSMEDVWNGERMRRLRERLRQGKYDEIELCRSCSDIEALSERFAPPD